MSASTNFPALRAGAPKETARARSQTLAPRGREVDPAESSDESLSLPKDWVVSDAHIVIIAWITMGDNYRTSTLQNTHAHMLGVLLGK